MVHNDLEIWWDAPKLLIGVKAWPPIQHAVKFSDHEWFEVAIGDHDDAEVTSRQVRFFSKVVAIRDPIKVERFNDEAPKFGPVKIKIFTLSMN